MRGSQRKDRIRATGLLVAPQLHAPEELHNQPGHWNPGITGAWAKKDRIHEIDN